MSWLQQRSDRIDGEPLDARRTIGLLVGLFGVSACALLVPSMMADIEAMYPSVDLDQPYLSTLSPALLYLRMPLAVVGACTVFLLPGALLALHLDWARSWTRLLTVAFGASVVLSSGTGLLLDAALGRPAVGATFVGAQIGIAALLALGLIARLRRGYQVAFELAPGPSTIGLVGLPIALLIGLTPKLFWEAANDDGNQILEISRLLLQQPLPFLGPEAGPYRSYPGVNMMLVPYPLSAFVRLFGVHMAAVRVPVVLFVAALYAVIVEVAQARRSKLGALDHLLLSLGLVAFTLTMSYSATWDPYCADMGLPATQDALLMFLFLAATLAVMDGQRRVAAAYATLMVLCSPNGLALLAMFAGAVWLSSRHQPARVLLTVLGGIVLGVVVLKLANAGAVMAGATSDSEHSAENLGAKLMMISPFDFRRALFMLLPCGLFPMAVLPRLRAADDATRAFVIIALGNFVVFYGLSFITLHYFVPSMVLPIVAFARHFRTEQHAGLGRAAALAAATVAIVLCLPRSSGIYTSTRDLGAYLDVSGASGYWQSESRIFGPDEPFREVFVADSHIEVPQQRWGGSWRAMRHYAELDVGKGVRKNYFLTDRGAPAPQGTQLIASNHGGAVYVRDPALWEQHKYIKPRVSTGHDFFIIPRPVLFSTSEVGKYLTIYSIDKELKKRPALGYGALGLAALLAPLLLLRIRRLAMATDRAA